MRTERTITTTASSTSRRKTISGATAASLSMAGSRLGARTQRRAPPHVRGPAPPPDGPAPSADGDRRVLLVEGASGQDLPADADLPRRGVVVDGDGDDARLARERVDIGALDRLSDAADDHLARQQE